MADKMFAVAGLAQRVDNASWHVKFAQDVARKKVLERGNEWHNTVFVQLPVEMNKIDATNHLKGLDQFAAEEFQKAFADVLTEKPVKAPKAPKAKAPKEKAPKAVKLVKARVAKTEDKPKVKNLTVEEINDIKAKNLARIKAASAKFRKGQIAEGAEGGFTPEQESEAKAYIEAVNNDLESFKAPESLTMDEVKALV